VRLFEIHDQPWFPQFLRDQFVDGLQMILDVTNIYQPIAQLLRERLEECGSARVLDLFLFLALCLWNKKRSASLVLE
jgi:hypothetical protein